MDEKSQEKKSQEKSHRKKSDIYNVIFQIIKIIMTIAIKWLLFINYPFPFKSLWFESFMN
jgi:hypothetical protein